MPKHNWLFSLVACAGLLGLAAPVYGQALLPYTLELDSEQLEQQGLNLVQDAVQLVRFQQYNLALPRAKLATQLAPNLFQAWFILGSLYVQNQEIDQGIESLKKAQSLIPPDAPEEAGILFTLGSAYFQKDNFNAAVDNIESGLAIDPDSIDALFDLGNSYLKLQQYPKAILAYERAFNQSEDFWPAINNVGLVQYEQGKVEAAIENWQKALAIDTDAPEPQLAIAVAIYTQGGKIGTEEERRTKQSRGITLGQAALSIDRRYADQEFLKENLWGDKLLEDTKIFLADPKMKVFLNRFGK